MAKPRYVQTLALVERLTFDDLARAVPLDGGWQRRGLAVPLLLSRTSSSARSTSSRSSTATSSRTTSSIVGDDPFAGVRVADADRRRGCEQQAKSHLIHLREGFLETQGDPRDRRAPHRVVGAGVSHAAPQPDARSNAARAASTADAAGARGENRAHHRRPGAAHRRSPVGAGRGLSTIADPTALLARYIDASERIWRYVDGWRA